MANPSYEKDGKIFLQCKECLEFKEINSNNWYYHKEGYLGVLGRCKNCILKGRKTNHELEMSRKRDKDRYYNNKKRREYIFKTSEDRVKRHNEENPKWKALHLKTIRLIKKLKYRPNKCPICGYEGRVIAHHPDINKWNEVVMCCQICHDKIHKGKMICPESTNLLELLD